MLSAAKFEETMSPRVEDFALTTDNSFSVSELLKMERVILGMLDFNLATPLTLHFLRRFSKAGRSESKAHTLAKYLAELSNHYYVMLQYRPSQIAAGAVYLARHMHGIESLWNSNLRHYTQYSEEEVRPCAELLNNMLFNEKQSRRPKAVTRKYSHARLYAVATIPYAPL